MRTKQCIAVYAGAVGRLNSLMVNAGSGREIGAGWCIGGIWAVPYGDSIL